MDAIWILLTIVLVLVGGVILADIWLKEILPEVAKKGKFASSIKKGRGKLILQGEKTFAYYGNVSEQGKKVDVKTGEVSDLLPGETNPLDELWSWKRYGVIINWWGKSEKVYHFEKDGVLINASSMFLINPIDWTIKNLEAKGGIRLDIEIQLILEATHFGKTVDVENWVAMLKKLVTAKIKPYVAKHDASIIMKQKVEAGSEGLYQLVMEVNSVIDDTKTTEGLLGQKISSFSSPGADYAPDEKDSMEAKAKAKNKKAADLVAYDEKMEEKTKEADRNLQVADKQAQTIKKIGDATNEVLKKTAELIGKEAAGRLNETIAIAEAIKKACPKALSFGRGGNASVILGDDDVNKEKKEGDKK